MPRYIMWRKGKTVDYMVAPKGMPATILQAKNEKEAIAKFLHGRVVSTRPDPTFRKRATRKISPYNKHMGRELKKGKTFKQAAASWKKRR